MTHVSTYTGVEFANPYLVCNQCGGWITGALDNPGPSILMPCEHRMSYHDVCPSWSPVDGCLCQEMFGKVDHAEPPRRIPTGDGGLRLTERDQGRTQGEAAASRSCQGSLDGNAPPSRSVSRRIPEGDGVPE